MDRNSDVCVEDMEIPDPKSTRHGGDVRYFRAGIPAVTGRDVIASSPCYDRAINIAAVSISRTCETCFMT